MTRTLSPIRLLTIAILGAIAVTGSLADTTVPGGTISTDTTWDLAGSPYIVTGHVYVPPGDPYLLAVSIDHGDRYRVVVDQGR